MVLGLLGMALMQTVVAHADPARAQLAPTPPPDQVTITITVREDGQVRTFRKAVPGSDIRAIMRGTRQLLVRSFAALPPPPQQYIFSCGGDFEQSDGSCNDVIVACAILDLEFECNKYDAEGVCTNGGC